jgi:hypothetical protein
MNIMGLHICMDEIRYVLPALPAVLFVARALYQRATGRG